MHELSIAQGILEHLERHVPFHRWPDVREVRLRVGPMAGVVVDSLKFCFDAVVRDTAMAQASLEIEPVPMLVDCPSCGRSEPPAWSMHACPRCGKAARILSGTELELQEILLEDTREGVQ